MPRPSPSGHIGNHWAQVWSKGLKLHSIEHQHGSDRWSSESFTRYRCDFSFVRECGQKFQGIFVHFKTCTKNWGDFVAAQKKKSCVSLTPRTCGFCCWGSLTQFCSLWWGDGDMRHPKTPNLMWMGFPFSVNSSKVRLNDSETELQHVFWRVMKSSFIYTHLILSKMFSE